DEQLFFAGVLPYYAGERAAAVQVVYLISHFDTHERPHEQLNGLWAVGIRNYPVISDFPDLYSESLEGAISAFEAKGCTYEDFTAFIVENIRRFKPQVLVTHDINGEYGHGTHIYCTDVVTKSLPSISDASFCPESAEKYGTWDVPKTYLHLYEENSITMNWDIPLEAFGGKTAFEMTVIGFSYHKSQHWTWFNDWIHGKAGAPVTKATDIKTYSPCLYGLYRTTVGADVAGGDFLENITLYKDQLPPAQVTPETEPPVTGSSEPTDTAPAADSSESVANGARSPVVLVAIILIVALAILMIYLIFSSKNKNRR
ncbi:MAG: PIG-L family deacetylase, partial [Clostridia bacterium]|nr:PIG-L family deacetylase [Clostridia bacterium]